MEQGNEGDEIILLALRQIECSIGDEVTSIGQLQADTLVEVVARSLLLISEGEVKFPTTLPVNIASRHRICTNIATKVKELGFTGDCGYNQLLYPVEAQTKALLTWLVQKLPRSEEERAEEVLGANALLNRRMTDALNDWKHAPWLIHSSARGTPLRNICNFSSLRTSDDRSLNLAQAKRLFGSCSAAGIAAEPTLFELHAHELVRDQKYAARLESGITQAEESRQQLALLSLVRGAISVAKQQHQATHGGGAAGAGAGGDASLANLLDARHVSQCNQSLTELLASLSREAGQQDGAGGRGTRFALASEFAQDSTASIGGGGPGGSTVLSASGRDSAAALAASLSGLRAGLDAEDAAARLARQDQEESSREEELELIRTQVQQRCSEVESLSRSLGHASSRIRQLESELSSLVADGEALEKEVLLKRKTLEMLPSAVDNIGKLQTICGGSAQRLMLLAQEWETHRRPLVNKLRAKKNSKAQRRAQCKLMVDEMKRIREEMVVMIQDLRDKQDKSQLLSDEMARLPKNINRNLYTHRIMDIIASIAKQNKDIDKITGDIRDIQKTINTCTSTLQRADAVTEELVYNAANGPHSEAAMVDTYRQLRSLRARFDGLVSTVGKIGQMAKQARDLEIKVDQEMARVSSNNFDRIKGDLDQVLLENSQLVAQIKSLSRQK